MVTTDNTPNDEGIEFIEPTETEAPAVDTPPMEDTPSTETTEEQPGSPDNTVTAPPEALPAQETGQQPAQPQQPQQQQQPPMSQQEINELYRRRNEEQDRIWKDQVGRTAQQYRKTLEDQGYMPDQATEQMRQYIRQEQKFRKQEQETADILAFQEGKKNATFHYMVENGLLSKEAKKLFDELYDGANSPSELESNVKRRKREMDLIAENTSLKQGRVSPQSFDNSQGAAEVNSNQDRLLEAYINGDRSEAAQAAARKITGL